MEGADRHGADTALHVGTMVFSHRCVNQNALQPNRAKANTRPRETTHSRKRFTSATTARCIGARLMILRMAGRFTFLSRVGLVTRPQTRSGNLVSSSTIHRLFQGSIATAGKLPASYLQAVSNACNLCVTPRLYRIDPVISVLDAKGVDKLASARIQE